MTDAGENKKRNQTAADRPPAPKPQQPNPSPEEAGGGVSERSVEEQLEAIRAERDEHYDQMLRARAELENFRKRSQKEHEENRRYQSLSLIRDLLPVLDNLDRAISAASAENASGLIEGVEMVRQQLRDTLARYSVMPIKSIGEPFDPNLHEAVQQLPSDEHPPMTVLQEIEQGHKLHDRVVRPSKVIVSSGPPEAKEAK